MPKNESDISKKPTSTRLSLALSLLCLLATTVFNYGCRENKPAVKIPDQIDFNFDVRPILVQNCYLCHGPDPSSRQAELRLDTYEGATALLKSGKGHAVVPGRPAQSEMIRRVTSTEEEELMPPPESNLELDAYDVAVLKKWIDEGASWKKHWAFIPPEQSQFLEREISGNVLDDYINAALGKKGLTPVREANKHSLIRRVAYLVTGLPPTPKQIDQYLTDESELAYEKMVDHFLQSKGFGERWARHWLDVVRYAESRGHEFDYEILGAWQYRDYLIRAFNNDIPYDQLVREHLAGDLLENPRWHAENGINESQLGTVFFALSEGTHSPVDVRKDEADRIDNMIDVTTKTFQSLTVSCARCHDHKFDPIPTADYYAMYGIMESSRFSPKSVELTYEKLKNLEVAQDLKNGLKNMLLGKRESNEIVQSATDVDTNYQVLGDFRGFGLDNWKSDGIGFGKESTLGKPEWRAGYASVKLESGKASSRYWSSGVFGALRSPNFEITDDFIGVRALGQSSVIRVIIDNFQLIQWPIYGNLERRIDSNDWQNVTFDVSTWKGHKAYIEVLTGTYDNHKFNLDSEAYIEAEYAISFNGDWPESVPSRFSEEYISIDEINKKLSDPATVDLQDLAVIQQQIDLVTPTFKDTSFFVGIEDGFGINSGIFERGNHTQETEKPIPRGFLSVFTENHEFDGTGSGRLDLAEAMLSRDNPLTSRVMVNRIWHHLFGRGLVETVDNFGLQGKLPTHPKLLDHLAAKFQNEGWSIKNVIKYILMSETFRRSVSASDQAKKQDPENLLLSHFPIRRLEGEAIRDGILAASGQLNSTVYGPPIPVHLTEFMTGRGRPELSGPLDGEGRRSIYTAVRRNFLDQMMLTFDRPIPFSTFGKRNVTNVPAQSLILMNDPFIADQAEKMAESILRMQHLDIDGKIGQIYLRTLSREPTKEETKQAKSFLETLAIDQNGIDNNRDVWKAYCHSIYNLKEFIYLI